MECAISVIIPNWNGEATIANCLDAVLASSHDSFEVIVVDDCSSDSSLEIINQYPCRLIQLKRHQGAAAARNAGASHARGKVLFFTDADCVILEDTLAQIENSFRGKGPNMIVGGTYTCTPYDKGFFNLFQSVFVHYSEVKNSAQPDYLATHAMIISAEAFRTSGGFLENFSLPIVEDVEFSHHLRQQGFLLLIDPQLQVRHIFNFSFVGSVKNAFRKSKFWTMYSLENQDLFKDSGCASYELKVNCLAFVVALLFLLLPQFNAEIFSPVLAAIPIMANLLVSRHLLKLYYRTGGSKIAAWSLIYYMLVYAPVVGIGGLFGLTSHFGRRKKRLLWTGFPLPHRDTKSGIV